MPLASTSLGALYVQRVQASPATVPSPDRSISPAAAAASSASGDGAWVSGPGIRRVAKPVDPWAVLNEKRSFCTVEDSTVPPGGGPSRCSSSPSDGSATWMTSVEICLAGPAVSSTR